MKTTPTFINANFQIRLVEPSLEPDPLTLRIPSLFSEPAYVDLDFSRKEGQVHLIGAPIENKTLDWLNKTEGSLIAESYPNIFAPTHKKICAELERVARIAIDAIKYFAARDEIADDPISPITEFNFSTDGNTFKPIPRLIFGFVSFKNQIAVVPKFVSDLQDGIDNGFSPFLAMRHLYRAIQETNPRFKWIDATIAAELAVKEALIRSNPLLEELIIEMPSPPLHKLYGSILKRYLGSESPYVTAINKGAQTRNHLVHRARETVVTKKEAEDYVNEVMHAIHHLYTLLYPDWSVTSRLQKLEHFWKVEPASIAKNWKRKS